MAEADAHWPVLCARLVLSSCRQVISLHPMATLLVTVVIPLQWVKERGPASLGKPDCWAQNPHSSLEQCFLEGQAGARPEGEKATPRRISWVSSSSL